MELFVRNIVFLCFFEFIFRTVTLIDCTFQASNSIEINDGGALFMKDSVIVSPITNVKGRGSIAVSGLILGNLTTDISSPIKKFFFFDSQKILLLKFMNFKTIPSLVIMQTLLSLEVSI
jgi:hypothetical protein